MSLSFKIPTTYYDPPEEADIEVTHDEIMEELMTYYGDRVSSLMGQLVDGKIKATEFAEGMEHVYGLCGDFLAEQKADRQGRGE